MHILIVPSELYLPVWRHTSGVFQRQAAAALSRKGHRVGVLSVGFVTLPNLVSAFRAAIGGGVGINGPDGVAIVRVWVPLPMPYRWLPVGAFRGLVELASRRAFDRYVAVNGLPDVLHGHDPLWGGWISNSLARIAGRVSLLTVHTSAFARGLIARGERKLVDRVLNDADVVSTVSQSLSTLVSREFSIKDPAVLPNVIDEDYLKNPRSASGRDAFVFFSAGTLDENKNHSLLIQAFASSFRGTAVSLRIAGDGPLRASLIEQARTLGVAPQISFLGMLDKPRMLQEFGRASCFVLPSRYETFGVVVLEALASGVPVIATRCGGPEEVVAGDCGLIVEPDDVLALAGAMSKVHDSAGVFDAEALRSSAATRFGQDAYEANIRGLLNQVAGNPEQES